MTSIADNFYSKLSRNEEESIHPDEAFQLELPSFDDATKKASLGNEDQSFDIGQEDPLTEDIYLSNEAKSNRYMAFMNMANSILGSGVIGQPFAMKNCGIIGV